MNELAMYIKKKRENKKISQRELARRTNLDNGTIAKIEKGLIKKPSYETLKKLNFELNNNDFEELDNILKIAKYNAEELLEIGHIIEYFGIAGSGKINNYMYKINNINGEYIDIIKALRDYKSGNLNDSEMLGIISIFFVIDIKKYIPDELVKKYNIYFSEHKKSID